MTILKFMIIFEQKKKNVWGELLLWHMIAFIFIFTVIFINPHIRLKKCIVSYHLWVNFKRTKLLIKQTKWLKYFRYIFQRIPTFNRFNFLKTKQLLRTSKRKADILLIKWFYFYPLAANNLCCICLSPLIEFDLFLYAMNWNIHFDCYPIILRLFSDWIIVMHHWMEYLTVFRIWLHYVFY